MTGRKQTARKSTGPPTTYAMKNPGRKVQTDECQGCEKQFVAETKIVKETKCVECRIANYSEAIHVKKQKLQKAFDEKKSKE